MVTTCTFFKLRKTLFFEILSFIIIVKIGLIMCTLRRIIYWNQKDLISLLRAVGLVFNDIRESVFL